MYHEDCKKGNFFLLFLFQYSAIEVNILQFFFLVSLRIIYVCECQTFYLKVSIVDNKMTLLCVLVIDTRYTSLFVTTILTSHSHVNFFPPLLTFSLAMRHSPTLSINEQYVHGNKDTLSFFLSLSLTHSEQAPHHILLSPILLYEILCLLCCLLYLIKYYELFSLSHTHIQRRIVFSYILYSTSKPPKPCSHSVSSSRVSIKMRFSSSLSM